MKNKYIIFIAFISIISLFACEKDEQKAMLKSSIVAPVLEPISNMILQRDNATDPITISGTDADFGYQASVNYVLEACVAGTNFANPIELGTSPLHNIFKFTVSSLNAILIKTLPESEIANLEFRVRAVIVSSETGGATPIESVSATTTSQIKTFGPPSLYLTGDANIQRLVSASDDGIYSGWIYTDGTAFTLTNKDDGKIYGASGAVVSEGGNAIALEAGGYNIEVNLNTMAIKTEDVTICMIGDAVGGWGDGDETKMIWDFSDQTWNVRINVVNGGLKFRTRKSWSAVNVAYDPAGHDLNKLYQSVSGADSQNIDDIAPGTYDVKLYLNTTPMKAVFTPAK